MQKEVLAIEQKNVSGADLSVELVNGQELRVKRNSTRATLEYRINILVLKDRSKRVLSFAWKWLFAGMFLITLALSKNLYLLVASAQYVDEASYVGIVLGVFCFFMVWKTTILRQVFFSRNTNIPLLEMAVGKPCKEEFLGFVKSLEESIQRYRADTDVPEQLQNTGEMKTLRRLSEQGVVSVSAYDEAKATLLEQS